MKGESSTKLFGRLREEAVRVTARGVAHAALAALAGPRCPRSRYGFRWRQRGCFHWGRVWYSI